MNSEGRISFANETLAGWLGYSRADLSDGSLGIGDILTSDDTEAAPRPAAGPVRLRDRQGRVFRAVLTQPSGAEPGATSETEMLIVHDLVSEQEWQANQRRSGQRLHRYFDAAPVAIVQLDLDGTVVECNQAFRKLLGLSGESLIGKLLLSVIEPGDRREFAARLDAAKERTTGLAPLDITLTTPTETTFSLYASHLEGDDGVVIGVILHFIDTSEQKKLEQQFLQAHKMKAVGQLAGGVARFQ